MPFEHLIRGADNAIKMTLLEDGLPISGAWQELDVWIGETLNLHRTADGDGISLSTSTGLFTLIPADLTAPEIAALELLTAGHTYRVQIVVTSVLNDDGAVFGGSGSSGIFFRIADKPE